MDWLHIVLTAIIMLCPVSVMIWWNPALLHGALLRLLTNLGGLTVKQLNIRNGQRVAYAECGNHPSASGVILLLHGYSSSKHTFVDMVRHLPSNYRIIAIDLPGHGGSDEVHPKHMTTEAVVDFIHEVCVALGLTSQSLHVIGTSLGGVFAGMYAARHGRSDHVRSLTLMNSSGVRIGKKTLVETVYEETGQVLLLPSTTEHVRNLMSLNSVKQFAFMPDIILRGYIQDREKRTKTLEALLLNLADDKHRFILEGELRNIKIPTLVMWGNDDKILDVSSVAVFKRELPSCEVHVFENCGHDIVRDCAKEAGERIGEFVQEHN